MSRLKLSVVLCTYNGSTYLADQLRSLASQIRWPDELVVFDDASTDATFDILHEFARTAPFPVRIHRNAENVGYRRNFANAIAAAKGDVLFLCDQDDVWVAEKLARMEAAFLNDPALGLAFTDALVVDEQLRSLGYALWDSAVRFTRALREEIGRGRGFDALLRGNVVTGATMAFRSAHRDLVLPVDESAVHDAWIALLIAAVAPIAMVAEPLILYRQHGDNEVGSAPMGGHRRVARARQLGRETLVDQRGLLSRARDRLDGTGNVDLERLASLADSLDHLDARLALPRARLHRIPGVARELVRGRYHRRSNGLSSAFRDLIL